MSSDNNSRVSNIFSRICLTMRSNICVFKKVQTMHRSLIFVKNNGHDTILKMYCNFKRQCPAAAVILVNQIFFSRTRWDQTSVSLKVQTMHRSMIFFKNNGYVSISKMYYHLNQCAAAIKSLHPHLKKCKPCNFTWVIGIKYDIFFSRTRWDPPSQNYA